MKKVLGKIYVMKEDNFPHVFQSVIQFLDSKPADDYQKDYQKIKTLYAMFQFLFENLLISEEIFSVIRKFLSKDKYRKYFIAALNQKNILDFFLKENLYAEVYAQPIVGNVSRLFNEKSVSYILCTPDIHPKLFTIFGCHPALIKNLDLQKHWVQCFCRYPEISRHLDAAYVTDDALDLLNEKEAFNFACALAESGSIKKISFSIDKLKHFAHLRLIAGEDVKKTKKCLTKLNNMQFIYDPNPEILNIDVEQFERFSSQDFLFYEAVDGALELLHSHNLGIMVDYVGCFLDEYQNEEEAEKIYINFRNRMLNLIEENPNGVSVALYFNIKNSAVRRLLRDEYFKNAVEELRKKDNLPSDFYYFSREILQYS